MGAVLTTASTVTCGHGGKIGVVGRPKLTVESAPVLVKDSVEGMQIAPPPPCTCPIPVTGDKICDTVSKVNDPSLSSKLFVDGDAVLLDTLSGMTNGLSSGTPQLLLKGKANQSKLTAAEHGSV